mgnify:CR=1 FL=1
MDARKTPNRKAAGIAVASSLRARAEDLSVAIIDPAQVHYYQPGWTLVGAGVFQQQGDKALHASKWCPVDHDRPVQFIVASFVGEVEPLRKVVVHLNGAQEFEQITLYSLTGQMMKNIAGLRTNHWDLDVSQLPNGIYVLQVATPTGVVNRKIEIVH